QREPEMSSVPPLKKCSTFLRLATSDTASATPEDQGPIMNFAPSPSIASSARRVEVPACVAPSRVMYLMGWPRIFMPRSSSAMRMPRSLSGPTSANAPVWSHSPRITTSFCCARMMAGKPGAAAAAPAFRICLRFIGSSLEVASLLQTLPALSSVPNLQSRMGAWPAFPYEEWKNTYQTLHRWLQVAGKVRLAQSPWVNHQWHVTLYVTSRGLTTSPIPHGTRTFEIVFDFIDSALWIHASDGR